uniref:Putative secreted protein n=1 Tax=Rhipicephalus microplus TaxID=6941 RepID=A0A6M2DB64_RHIMP
MFCFFFFFFVVVILFYWKTNVSDTDGLQVLEFNLIPEKPRSSVFRNSRAMPVAFIQRSSIFLFNLLYSDKKLFYS